MTLEERAKEIVERLQNTTDDFNVDDVLVALRYAQAEAYAKAAAVAAAKVQPERDTDDEMNGLATTAYNSACEEIAEDIRNLATDGDKP